MAASVRTRSATSGCNAPHRAQMPFAAVLALLGAFLLVQSAPAYDVCSDAGACIHEYMAEQALALYSNDEIYDDDDDHAFFHNHIRVGVTHEDEFDHIFSFSGFENSLVTMTHFWDADAGPDDPVVSLVGTFPNGWHKVKSFWALALGAYAKGDKSRAYHWLGHVVHHMGDNTLPTHVHDDMHFPDDDAFEDWMSLGGFVNAGLTAEEKAALLAAGPIQIPASEPDKLYWLLYTTNQIADFFTSDDYDGDAIDANGWVQAELDSMAALGLVMPRTTARMVNNDEDQFGLDHDNDDDGDLSVIRHYSYLRGIRSIAALYKLFADTVGPQVSAVVVIDHVSEVDDDHDDLSGADFWSRVSINGRIAQNRGDEILDTENIAPGWAFGQVVGTTGSIPMWIEIWDNDGETPPVSEPVDDQSDVTPSGGRRLDFTLDVAKCLNGEAGAISGEIIGNCRDFLTTTGTSDDASSILIFRVFMSQSPPAADAGGPHTTPEGTNVTLDAGGSTDPDGDITSYAWDLDGDGDCDDATGMTTTFSAVGQDAITTVKVCVTDAAGLTGDATTTVNVTNVPPSISLGSDSPNTEGSITTVTATITDPGWLDTLSATIAWGDGTTQALGGTAENVRPDATLAFGVTHVYGDNGSFIAQVCAGDDDTSPCQNILLEIGNVIPSTAINLSGAVGVNGTPTFIIPAGDSLDITGRSTDPGSDDLTLAWNWGDGTVAPSTQYLVNPPASDPALSPSVQPRDVSDPQTHVYADACAYQLTFSSVDDDGASSVANANVIIVGNGTDTGLAGYWHSQFQSLITGKGKPAYSAAKLTCYLEIARYMSQVFNEARSASTFAQAEDVLMTNGTSDMKELFDQQLLAAWLNFANGITAHDLLVDTNGDKVLDTPFLTALSAAETVRLDPGATRQQLEVQKNFLERVNQLTRTKTHGQ